jgi:hypothetical protein
MPRWDSQAKLNGASDPINLQDAGLDLLPSASLRVRRNIVVANEATSV